MHIKSIKKAKNGFYKIEGEKSFLVADDLILKYNILFKKEIDDSLINEILEENYKYDILNKTLKYINTKMRSSYEIDKYLNKYELDQHTKKFIKDKLTNLGLINDINFAISYTNDRINLYSDGPNKIKKDLLSHKISEDIIDKALANIDDNLQKEKLTKLITKKIRNNTKYTASYLKKKIEYEFINLGYDINLIDEVFDNNMVSFNEENLLEKEFAKIYSKYKNKYDQVKLKTVIKQKLYVKGFNTSDINNIVNKNFK